MESHLGGLLLLCFIFTSHVLGALINVTIDDQNGDSVTGNLVQYSPTNGIWNQGNNCPGCSAKPSSASAHDGTWHDGSRTPERDIDPLTFTLQFKGTAVYVFTIAAQQTLTDVNFTLDGTWIGRYTEFYDISDQFVYNFPILSKDNIPFGDHTLTVDAFGPNQTLVLFDYAIYTTTLDDPTDSSGSPSAVPAAASPHLSVVAASQSSTASSSSVAPNSAVSTNSPFFSSSPTISNSSTSSSSSAILNLSTSSHSFSPGSHLSTASLPSVSANASITPLPQFTLHETNVRAIAGGAIGGSVFLILLGLSGFCCFRRRRHIAPEVTPFEPRKSMPPKEPFISTTEPISLKVSFISPTSEVPQPPLNVAPSDCSSLMLSDPPGIRGQLVNFSTESNALRGRKGLGNSDTPHSLPSPPSSGVISQTSDIAMLRQEVAQLRARQDLEHRSELSPPQISGDLVRELEALRAELHEMRAQHELPRYSPPPPFV